MPATGHAERAAGHRRTGPHPVTATLPDAAMAKAENNKADFRIASGSPVIVHSAQATMSGAGVVP
jgi:hypothetical protein